MGWVTLAFGVFGLACSAVIVAAQADSFSPLLALPVAALAGATVAPRFAAVAMCAWCCLSSLGLFMAPCAAAMVAGARRTL
jgi:hypothetical protein